MSRIKGITKGGSLLARLTRLGSKRMLGKVVTPVTVMSHSNAVLWGAGQMDLAQNSFKAIPTEIRHLAEMRVATLVGCPF